MTGRLIAIVGPSGAGKDTLIEAVLAARPDLIRARRVITRPEEAGGENSEGVTRAEFERRRKAGSFLFWWEAHGLLYGIPATVERDLAASRTVIFNGSRRALDAIRAKAPSVEVVAVTAPAHILADRLAARGRENADDIRARLERAGWPIPERARVVVNDASVEVGAGRLLEALDSRPGSSAPAPAEATAGRKTGGTCA